MEKKDLKELNDEQLKNVAGGIDNPKGGSAGNNCFQNCLKELNHPYSSQKDDEWCRQQCATKQSFR